MGPGLRRGRWLVEGLLPFDKRNRQPIDVLLLIPWHHVLTAVHDVEIDLGMALLEKLGALAGMGAILAAIDQQHRDLEIEHTLPLRDGRRGAAAAGAFFRTRAPGEDLEVAADAAA